MKSAPIDRAFLTRIAFRCVLAIVAATVPLDLWQDNAERRRVSERVQETAESRAQNREHHETVERLLGDALGELRRLRQ